MSTVEQCRAVAGIYRAGPVAGVRHFFGGLVRRLSGTYKRRETLEKHLKKLQIFFEFPVIFFIG